MLYHTPVVAPRRGRIGFTLIEMIGVLAFIAIQINGPFGKDALSDRDFIEATLAGQGISSIGGLEGADVWFTAGDNPGEYHAYAYVFHL